MVRIIQHPTLGPITLKRGKNIRLSVHPIDGISMSIPHFVSIKNAMIVLDAKTEWILKAQKRHEERRQESIIYVGSGKTIKLITKDLIILDSVAQLPQELMERYILKEIKNEAQSYLPSRTKELAGKYGFNPGNITVRNNRSRWGSCSRNGNISLNIHLMRLTPQLADFIIIHELCHLEHPDHGARFHQLLNNLCGGKEKEYNREIRKKSPQALFLKV